MKTAENSMDSPALMTVYKSTFKFIRDLMFIRQKHEDPASFIRNIEQKALFLLSKASINGSTQSTVPSLNEFLLSDLSMEDITPNLDKCQEVYNSWVKLVHFITTQIEEQKECDIVINMLADEINGIPSLLFVGSLSYEIRALQLVLLNKLREPSMFEMFVCTICKRADTDLLQEMVSRLTVNMKEKNVMTALVALCLLHQAHNIDTSVLFEAFNVYRDPHLLMLINLCQNKIGEFPLDPVLLLEMVRPFDPQASIGVFRTLKEYFTQFPQKIAEIQTQCLICDYLNQIGNAMRNPNAVIAEMICFLRECLVIKGSNLKMAFREYSDSIDPSNKTELLGLFVLFGIDLFPYEYTGHLVFENGATKKVDS